MKPQPPSDPFERHFTPKQLAELWGFDPNTIRRMFIDEPGVLKVGKQVRRDAGREIRLLRVPELIAMDHDRNGAKETCFFCKTSGWFARSRKQEGLEASVCDPFLGLFIRHERT
jgi:hypothetical protein